MNRQEQQQAHIDSMERTQGWIETGLGLTISAGGVMIAVTAALVEGTRQLKANLYSAVAELDVDPGTEPIIVALGVGGMGLMGAGVYVANQGISTLERVRDRRRDRQTRRVNKLT